MDDAIINAVREHAASEEPRECCGVVVVQRGKRQYRPCRNVAVDGNQFQIDARDWVAAEEAGAIVAVCHSHVYQSPEPSVADRVECERSGLPWLIVNYPLGHAVEFEPAGYEAPLLGRTFAHGVLDCYSIVRDHYARELGIGLPDFDRPYGWWNQGRDLYRENFAAAGFSAVQMSALLPHDVVLIKIRAAVPNHAAVYLGQNKILQHLERRLSSRDVYGGWYQKCTTHVLRHASRC